MSYDDDTKPLPGSAFEKMDLLDGSDADNSDASSTACWHPGFVFIGIGGRGDWACKKCGKWKKDIDKEDLADLFEFETFDDEDIDFGQCD